MKNGDKPSFPPNAGWEHSESKGLTKREYFAALAMQGLLADPNSSKPVNGSAPTAEIFAIASVKMADRLLAELEKEGEGR